MRADAEARVVKKYPMGLQQAPAPTPTMEGEGPRIAAYVTPKGADS